MPKLSLPPLPISAMFGVIKPSGPTSMSIVNDVKLLASNSRLFVKPSELNHQTGDKKQKLKGKKRRGLLKMGQGGTLDPLADGVLVVGIGRGTKQLSDFLNCAKEYRTTCLLGCETDSYDSEGARVRIAPWRHVTRELVESKLELFRGKIQQAPPIFSAIKMDGRPLYEYARKGISLPRPIEKRDVTVYFLDLIEWKGSDHDYRWPDKQFSEEEKAAMEKALRGADNNVEIQDEPEDAAVEGPPTAFVLSMKVSGGVYVRSIVHDLSHALGSAGHVVSLTRSRQGRYALEPTEDDRGCIPWDVFRHALEGANEVDEEGWTEWEREVISHLEIVEGSS